MLSDKKFIFVSYFPGSGGRMIAELCNILIDSEYISSKISNTGEIMTANELEILLSKAGSLLDSKDEYTEDEQVLFTAIMNTWLSGKTSTVVSSHLLNFEQLSKSFVNTKFIVIYPQTLDEFELIKTLWVIKNQSNEFQRKFRSDINFQSVVSRWEFHPADLHEKFIDSNKFLHLSVSDIFNDTKIEETINLIDNFITPRTKLQNKKSLEMRQQRMFSAITYYKKYMEINKNNF